MRCTIVRRALLEVCRGRRASVELNLRHDDQERMMPMIQAGPSISLPPTGDNRRADGVPTRRARVQRRAGVEEDVSGGDCVATVCKVALRRCQWGQVGYIVRGTHLLICHGATARHTGVMNSTGNANRAGVRCAQSVRDKRGGQGRAMGQRHRSHRHPSSLYYSFCIPQCDSLFTSKYPISFLIEPWGCIRGIDKSGGGYLFGTNKDPGAR